ncbi:MAG: nucleotidyltransferase domain-containing protein [Nanoarchaeota archaeon]|nr:nucleotidyltransferase domain-containing protein [Nanoarchaeota archaeon]
MNPVNKKAIKELKVRLKLRERKPGTITEKEIRILYDFTKKLVNKFGGFVHALILFGSVSREEKKKESDLDVLALVDDVSFDITPEIVGSWRLSVGSILSDLNAVGKIHVTTLGLTQFWDAVRHADPVIITILRDGQPVVDTGFFKPLKKLLETGRIRPSRESIEAHLMVANRLIGAADTHVLAAFDDLYWAVINSAHSALMSKGHLPRAPSEVPQYFKKYLMKKKYGLDKKDADFLAYMIRTMKHIARGELNKLDPVELNKAKLNTKRFVKKISKIVLKK